MQSMSFYMASIQEQSVDLGTTEYSLKLKKIKILFDCSRRIVYIKEDYKFFFNFF